MSTSKSSAPRVTRIVAHGFRGVGPETCIRTDGRNLVLLGDNGSGKTSFVDAIEYALTGDVKSLSRRGQRLSLKRHLANVHFPGTTPRAQLELSGGETDCVMVNGVVTDGGLSDSFLAGARNGNFILRRRQLLSFLEAEDRDRYQMLRPFLDLGAFDGIEAAAKEAARLAKAAAGSTKRDVERSTVRARVVLRVADDADLDDAALLEVLNDRLRAAGVGEAVSLGDVCVLRSQMETKLSGAPEDLAAVADREAEAALQECVELIPTSEELDHLVGSYESSLADDAECGRLLEEVLLQGSEWIRADSLDSCPLCEQPIERHETLERIRARLEMNAARIGRRQTAREALSVVRSSLTVLIATATMAQKKWQDAHPRQAWPLSDMAAGLDQVATTLKGHDLSPDMRALRVVVARIRKWHLSDPQAGPKADARVANDVASQDDDHPVLTARDTLKWLEDDLPELRETRAADSRARRMAQLSTRLHAVAEEARKSVVSRLFSEIEHEIADVYKAFHPGEGLGGFRITMKDYAEGSAVLTGDFHTKTGEDPRAYYSEAHQDTLGLAVFLALCRQWSRQYEGFRLVVLDDVLSSIDGPHRARVAEYIVGPLAATHQVLLTTHDSVLFERLFEVQKALGKQAAFANKRIVSYAFDCGPRLGEMQFDYDKLCANLADVPHDEILLFAGRLLDDLLNDLRFTLKLSVPAEPSDRYAVGHLWGQFRKKTKCYPGIAGACEALDATTYMRNIGVHSQLRTLKLSRAETLEFVDAVRGLYDATTCPKCGSRVRVSSGGDASIACRKGCLTYVRS